MPYYDYECLKCGIFEVRRSIKDDPLKECPTCGREIRRLFHPTPFIIAGNNKPDRVRGVSGQLGQRVSDTDKSNIDTYSPQRADSKGRPKATPTRSKSDTINRMRREYLDS